MPYGKGTYGKRRGRPVKVKMKRRVKSSRGLTGRRGARK